MREAPRNVLPAPSKLLPFPPSFPSQAAPFIQPATLEETIACLLKPLSSNLGLSSPPVLPPKAKSAHPFHGGEINGHIRIRHIVTSGCINTYQDTRNGMLGADFSTKLSAWLALGCVTARQVHHYLVDFEEGRSQLGKDVEGYGKGENKGTTAIRFELLWRDYFHLATRKFGPRLFRIGGFKDDRSFPWQYPEKNPEVQHQVDRFLAGKTGIGFIDASMRELFHTGYTSNRLRQNVASFLAKHLGIDWRIGAEWYESLLCDYDVSSNWGNWQYLAGVGNDPREARVFNPVKQVAQPLCVVSISLAQNWPGYADPYTFFRPTTMTLRVHMSRIGSPSCDPLTMCEPYSSPGDYPITRNGNWVFRALSGWKIH